MYVAGILLTALIPWPLTALIDTLALRFWANMDWRRASRTAMVANAVSCLSLSVFLVQYSNAASRRLFGTYFVGSHAGFWVLALGIASIILELAVVWLMNRRNAEAGSIILKYCIVNLPISLLLAGLGVGTFSRA